MSKKHRHLTQVWYALVGYIVLLMLVTASCPSYANTLQPGWVADTKTGCRVWDPHPEPNESVAWSGACESGYAQGKGVEQWYSGGKPGNRLEGEFHDGMLSRGIVIYPNGDRYDGDLNGGRSGYGIYVSKKGSRYEGEWRDNKRNGRGVMTWPSGDRYEGYFRDGKRDGHGVFTWANGDSYDGEWRDNRQNGHGVFTTPNGRRYDGEWSDGKVARALYEIPLQEANGVFKLPVNINGTLTLEFTLDSGASDVSIPADVVLTLFRTGTLTGNDFLGRQIYRLADGSSVPSDTFRIRSLRVGNLELKNVVGSVSSVSGVPLLGQSFLSRLGRWSIDNQRHVLVIESEATNAKATSALNH